MTNSTVTARRRFVSGLERAAQLGTVTGFGQTTSTRICLLAYGIPSKVVSPRTESVLEVYAARTTHQRLPAKEEKSTIAPSAVLVEAATCFPQHPSSLFMRTQPFASCVQSVAVSEKTACLVRRNSRYMQEAIVRARGLQTPMDLVGFSSQSPAPIPAFPRARLCPAKAHGFAS